MTKLQMLERIRLAKRGLRCTTRMFGAYGWLCVWLFVCPAHKAQAARAKASAHHVVLVRRDGVGPLTKATPVDAKVLQHLFKGCKLAAVLHSIKGKPTERTIAVTCQKKLLYTLHTETDLRTLSYVEIHAPFAKTQDQVGIGDKLGRLYGASQVDCDAGTDPKRRLVQCTRIGRSAFAYRAIDTGRGPQGLLPSPEALKRLTITSLVWRASMI